MVALAAVVAGCGGSSSDGGELRVVATTGQLGDFARQVGGGRVSVKTILDAKTDPHDYEPRPSDAQAIAEADVVLASGGEVDGWLEDLVGQAGGDAKRITLDQEIGVESDDPHWWQDPSNAAAAVERIQALLADEDADGASAYAARSEKYVARIRALDDRIESCMSSLKPERRKLVTNHDAFGYFARRYDIDVLGSIIPGRSTNAQASAGDVRKLVAAIKRENVRTIFPETSLNRRLEQAVARESGAKVGPALYADTVAPDGTYLTALRHDADAMADAFGGGCRL